MITRQIIKIDEEKCNGCGICVEACHEGALAMIDGKAKLIRDDYCDGLGDCLPGCPTGAITFETREALAYDEEAVAANMAKNVQGNKEANQGSSVAPPVFSGCPGSMARTLDRQEIPSGCPGSQPAVRKPQASASPSVTTGSPDIGCPSQLMQWPVQIKLAPINAGFFNGANLLIAADCSAFAYGNFHEDFMKNRITLIGCPKLDAGDYSEKLTAILRENNIKSVTVARMQVPCCGGLSNAVIKALKDCGKMIPWQIITIATDGSIIDC